MGRALYRSHRPKSLSEVVGQEPIVRTLQNAVKTGNISHAYLFTGPKGVGKTSVARILAYEVNGLPYDEQATTLDIIEIDAASNRRIDEIRELRNKVHIAPTSAKYKVYIIDEVHMLTKEAFNALLKTLEEPPAHAIFILATTEAHKLPETIISRTQRFTFKAIEPEQAVEHLRSIAKEEKIKISDEALALLAEHGDGSFRDSINLLDQVSQRDGKEVNGDAVRLMLGLAPALMVNDLYQSTFHGTTLQVLDGLEHLNEQGYEPAQVAKQLGTAVRHVLLQNNSPEAPEALLTLLRDLINVPSSSSPSSYLEVTLLGINLKHSNAAPKPAPTTLVDNPEKGKPPKVAEAKVVEKPVKELVAPVIVENTTQIEETELAKEKPKTKSTTNAPFDLPELKTAWPLTLNVLKKKYNTLYGILRMAQPSIDEDGNVVLAFKFPFHKKRISENKNMQIVHQALQEQLNNASFKIHCVILENATTVIQSKSETNESHSRITSQESNKDTNAQPFQKNGSLDNISNIFGSAEVLES
jgi:DNA polymerase-3 subunit gamma/tau